MTKRDLPLLILALAMIGATAGMLLQLRAHQKLGRPAVKTSPIQDSVRLQVELPERVLEYESEFIEPEKLALQVLPQDTSFGQRLYKGADGFEVSLSVVLMGSDRTSLHKPQICLSGYGWRVDDQTPAESTVQIDRPFRWELPVSKLVGTKELTIDGRSIVARRVYVYWFVAENECTARHWQRMWWMARDLLRTGVLQRWAYISCSAICLPGQEDSTFERLKTFIAAAVPEFQLSAEKTLVSKAEIPEPARASQAAMGLR